MYFSKQKVGLFPHISSFFGMSLNHVPKVISIYDPSAVSLLPQSPIYNDFMHWTESKNV